MGSESSGSDYLRRLKRDLEYHSGFPDSEARAPTGSAPAAGGERRRSPRDKCSGSAQFRIEGSDVHTWGTVTDISQNGCYVELMATFPVGANVDMQLELNGIRAHLKGEVRVSYPCLGMGIAFRDLSDENRVRLLEMLSSVSPAAPPVTPLVSEPPPASAVTPLALPIIINPAAALQALAEFFETHPKLSKEDFVRLLRKSQGLDEFRDNRR